MATIKKNKAKTETKVEETKVHSSTSPKKDKKGKKKDKAKKEADTLNINEAAEKAAKVNERDTKYIYPDNCTTAKDKKDFRRKMRSESKALAAKLSRLEKSDKKEDKVEARAVRKELEDLFSSSFNPNKSPNLSA